MWQILSRCAWKLRLWSYRRKIGQALALYRRGEVRRDGLTAVHVRGCLEIRWRARYIHPWDRHCARDEREALFAEQALADTEAAVHRLFERLPQIDVIELSVVEPTSENLIAEGTVHRSMLDVNRPLFQSVGMRLRELGISYRTAPRDDTNASNKNRSVGGLCVK